MRGYTRGKTRVGHVGGFLELRGQFGGSRSPKGVARKVLPARARRLARARRPARARWLAWARRPAWAKRPAQARIRL